MASRDPVRLHRYSEDNKYLVLPEELVANDSLETEEYRYLEAGIDIGQTKDIRVKYADIANKSSMLSKPVMIGLSGVGNHPQEFDGTTDINIPIEFIPAGLIYGTIPIENIPKGALERLLPVNTDEDRFKLTEEDVQNGDIVKVRDTDLMYVVIDQYQLNNENGYEVYKAGWASAVPWEGVTNKPISDSFENDDSTTIASSRAVFKLYSYMQYAMEMNVDYINQCIEAVINDTNNKFVETKKEFDNKIIDLINNGKVKYAENADQLLTARSIDGIDFNGTKDITHYGVCSSNANEQNKITTIEGFKLIDGARVAIKFNYSNTNTNPTLNINGTGAKPIVKYGTTPIDPNVWSAGAVVEFIYDGTSWCMTSSSGTVYYAGANAPTNTSILWIDSDATNGGLKYHNGTSWVHVPVAYS